MFYKIRRYKKCFYLNVHTYIYMILYIYAIMKNCLCFIHFNNNLESILTSRCFNIRMRGACRKQFLGSSNKSKYTFCSKPYHKGVTNSTI